MAKLSMYAVSLAFVSATMVTVAAANDLVEELGNLQREWAVINYHAAEEDKEARFETLVAKSEGLTQSYPQRAEPKVWEAIIRAGFAGAMGGVSSLFNAMPQMKKGRDLLLEAEKINPGVLNGSVYTTLGSFYYMVPGGLIGFGDSEKALAYLNRALEIAPNDMDANYFLGDYWFEQQKYAKAKPYFEKVLALPDVADRPVYSKGRKAEAIEKLAELSEKFSSMN